MSTVEATTKVFVCQRCPATDLYTAYNRKFCAECRVIVTAEKEKKRADARAVAAGRSRIGEHKECRRCHEPFVLLAPRQHYCPTCRPIAQQEQSLRAQSRAAIRHNRIGRGTPIKCAGSCGNMLLKTGVNQKYCEKCRREARAATKRKEYAKIAQSARQTLNTFMRTGIWKSLKGGKAGRSWESLVGYTVDDLKVHLELQFTGRMSWKNRHRWHIDHIRALIDFEFTTADDPQFKEAWARSNLRPLWKPANLKKNRHRTHLL